MASIGDSQRRLKQHAVHALRSLGLLGSVEWLNRRWGIAKSNADNDRFCREHSDFVPPPLAAMHDAYGTISFQSYWEGGQYFARVIAELIAAHHQAPRRILEWGCGPARIMRHLPRLLPSETELFGADYNDESITWCTATFPSIKFVQNALTPPLPFDRGFFSVIYAVSVFTHLSIKQQKGWAHELARLLADDGVLIFTVNGDRAAHLLLPHERSRYEAEGVVIRDHVKEGTRCYLAYNRPDYVSSSLFPGLTIAAHKPGYPSAPGTEQDVWALRRQM
jgi:SAM-dependent methyltransferase